MNSTISNTQSQLKDVQKLLKLDPGNAELGATTAFSATEVAGAMTEMAKAEWGGSYGVDNRSVYLLMPYLTTINNLDGAVVKTTDQTMRITYTLVEE